MPISFHSKTHSRATVEKYPPANAYLMLGLLENLRGLSINQAFFAKGAGRGDAKATSMLSKTSAGEYLITLTFHLKPGWYINSNTPNQQSLIPSTLSSASFATN